MRVSFKRKHALNLIARRTLSSCNPCQQDVRPSTAPKQTPDLRSIRHDPTRFSKNAVLRNYAQHQESPQRIADLVARSADLSKTIIEPRKEIKRLEQQYANSRRNNDEATASAAHAKIQELKPQAETSAQEQEECAEEAKRLALALPNLTSEQTPGGNEPKLLRYLNYDPANPPSYGKGSDHVTIGQELGILNFTSASMASGWGFYYLLNEAALLEQALVQYALAVAMRYGWKVVTPPSLVYSHIADSCGFQPRDANDEQQIWQVAQADKDEGKPKRSLAATAEIPLAALHADKAVTQADLPIKVVGSSRCYRAEAGARGVDTKGLYRVHEFTKVEMFAWTDSGGEPRDDVSEADWTKYSAQIFDEMVQIQSEILSSLSLPCRVLEMPASDMGASAFRKVDIEALFPSRMSRDQGWGELTSVSNCTDYQTRRLNTRIKEADGAQRRFPHTINGTATAIPRVLACILENGWRAEDKTVIIPKPLRPFMGGTEKIGCL